MYSVIFFQSAFSILITKAKEEKLAPDAMRVWSRPIEIGFQVAGSIEGSADNKISDPTVFDEAKSAMNFNLFSKNAAVEIDKLSPLAKVAAFNAIKAANADGMIITMVKETSDETGLKTAWVKGVALKIVIYDEVSVERSDAFRYCEISCEKGNCQSCPRIYVGKPEFFHDYPLSEEKDNKTKE